jgi:hypothetical protein
VVRLQESLFVTNATVTLAVGASSALEDYRKAPIAIATFRAASSALLATYRLSAHFVEQSLHPELPKLLYLVQNAVQAHPAAPGLCASVWAFVQMLASALRVEPRQLPSMLLDSGALGLLGTILVSYSDGTESAVAVQVESLALLATLLRDAPDTAEALAMEPVPTAGASVSSVADAVTMLLSSGSIKVRRACSLVIGNAAFHSPVACRVFRPAIEGLLGVLGNEDVVSRRHSSAALGNLVRHDESLVGAFLDHGVIPRLARVCLTEEDPQVRASTLFSLGTVASHPDLRHALLAMRPPLTSRLRALKLDEEAGGHLARLERKLAQHE